MIFPLSHERSTVRRLPWVTFTIIGLCLLANIATELTGGDVVERLGRQFEEALEYYWQHPYLELDPRLAELLFAGQREEAVEALQEVVKDFGASPPDQERDLATEQAHFDRLVERAFTARSQLPWYRWGLIPAATTLHGVVTHQFMHGGWLHLLGNMFFLYLAAPFVEDVWGRPIFASFYLAAGAVSGLAFAAHYPTLDAPLIGASGAVAGVMGAFLVRYWSTRIKFLFVFFLYIGTFTAPAWLMLPLWLARELLFAQANDVVGGGADIAHWAHVWGFMSGVAVAVGFKYFRVEERYLHRAIEAKVTLFDNSALDEILERYRQGEVDESLGLLTARVAAHPDELDAAVALWQLSRDQERVAAAAPALAAAVQRAARRGALAELGDLPAGLPRCAPAPYDPATTLRLVEHEVEQGRADDAAAILAAVVPRVGAHDSPALLLKLVRAGVALGSPAVAPLGAAALANPELPADAAAELRSCGVAAPPPPPAPPLRPVVRLKVMAAVPTRFVEGGLELEVGGQRRVLPCAQVAAVAAAVIGAPGERRAVLVDLLLDPPGAERMRVLRIESGAFDPRGLMGGDDRLAALRAFVVAVLDRCAGAHALPDPTTLRAGRYPELASLTAYETAVLRAR